MKRHRWAELIRNLKQRRTQAAVSITRHWRGVYHRSTLSSIKSLNLVFTECLVPLMLHNKRFTAVAALSVCFAFPLKDFMPLDGSFHQEDLRLSVELREERRKAEEEVEAKAALIRAATEGTSRQDKNKGKAAAAAAAAAAGSGGAEEGQQGQGATATSMMITTTTTTTTNNAAIANETNLSTTATTPSSSHAGTLANPTTMATAAGAKIALKGGKPLQSSSERKAALKQAKIDARARAQAALDATPVERPNHHSNKSSGGNKSGNKSISGHSSSKGATTSISGHHHLKPHDLVIEKTLKKALVSAAAPPTSIADFLFAHPILGAYLLAPRTLPLKRSRKQRNTTIKRSSVTNGGGGPAATAAVPGSGGGSGAVARRGTMTSPSTPDNTLVVRRKRSSSGEREFVAGVGLTVPLDKKAIQIMVEEASGVLLVRAARRSRACKLAWRSFVKLKKDTAQHWLQFKAKCQWAALLIQSHIRGRSARQHVRVKKVYRSKAKEIANAATDPARFMAKGHDEGWFNALNGFMGFATLTPSALLAAALFTAPRDNNRDGDDDDDEDGNGYGHGVSPIDDGNNFVESEDYFHDDYGLNGDSHDGKKGNNAQLQQLLSRLSESTEGKAVLNPAPASSSVHWQQLGSGMGHDGHGALLVSLNQKPNHHHHHQQHQQQQQQQLGTSGEQATPPTTTSSAVAALGLPSPSVFHSSYPRFPHPFDPIALPPAADPKFKPKHMSHLSPPPSSTPTTSRFVPAAPSASKGKDVIAAVSVRLHRPSLSEQSHPHFLAASSGSRRSFKILDATALKVASTHDMVHYLLEADDEIVKRSKAALRLAKKNRRSERWLQQHQQQQQLALMSN
jgi:hypothetical protein